MRWLASYIMRGRSPAVMVTVVTGVLSLVLPPLSFLSSAAVALVTLRLGAAQGGLLIALATLASGLLSALALGTPVPAVALTVGFWLPVWGLAWVLRRSISVGLVLNLVLVAGLALVMLVHAVVGDPAHWWQGQLEQVFAPVLQGADASQAKMLRGAFPVLAGMMTGIMVTAWLLNGVISLALARWWQAMLYNAGGFRQEFHGLQLGKPASLLAALVVLGAALAPQGLGGMALSLAIVVVTLLALQGLAIAHAWVAAGERHVLWLVALYMVMIVLMKEAALGLALVGILDPWLDVRRRFKRRADAA